MSLLDLLRVGDSVIVILFYLPNVLSVSTKNVELWPVLVDASGIFCGSIVQIQGLEDAYEDSLIILFPHDSCQG